MNIVNWEKIRDYLRRDEAFPHLLQFLLHILRGEVCQAVISILGTIVIALFIGHQRYDKWFYVCCVTYVVLIIGAAFGNNYSRYAQKTSSDENAEMRKQQRLMKHTTDSIRVVNGTASSGIYQIAREIKREGWPRKLKNIRKSFGFQTMSFAVCQEIYALIRDKFGLTNHYVTIYQRADDHTNSATNENQRGICKMIAYANDGNVEPLSYRTLYLIPDVKELPKEKNGIEYHTRIFAEYDLAPRILMTKEEIEENFKMHVEGISREMGLSQYIGIPSNVRGRQIVFLLQIDCSTANGFGDSREEVKSFADLVLAQYVSTLSLYYELDRMNEVTANYINDLRVTGSEVRKEEA